MAYSYLMCSAAIFSIAALKLLEMESLHKVVVDFGVQAMYLPRNLVPALEIGVALPLTRVTENFVLFETFNDRVQHLSALIARSKSDAQKSILDRAFL